jgi:predicted alpha/beta superfamily hydrolase
MMVRRCALEALLGLLFVAACGSSSPRPQGASPGPREVGAAAEEPAGDAARAQPVVLAPLGPEVVTAPPQAFTVESKALGEPRQINVYTPPGYATLHRRLPVVYLLDGGLKEDFPRLAAEVDRLIREGAVPPVLLVGIENTERRRDLTGPTEVAEDRKIAPRVGGSAAFRAFVRDELRPAVHARYCDQEDAAILGESLAALFVTETLLVEPALFRRFAALSPSLWWNGEIGRAHV